MKERDDHDKIQVREVVKRSLESGQTDDDIDVEKFDKRARTSNNGLTRPFKTVRKREEVDMTWVRADVASALPMIFFDNAKVHKAVLMTAECGKNYIDDKNMGKMRAMTQDLTTSVFNDGWTTVKHNPIVNIFMGVRSLYTLGDSIDMNDREPGAFHAQCMKSDMHVWISTFFKP